METLLEFALKYEKLGWFVLPAETVKKKPMIKWKDRCSRRPTAGEIQGWWKRWPNARIAIATGAYSGFDAVDVDGPNGFKKLCESCGCIPETIYQTTGRDEGGRHLLFKHDDHGLRPHQDGVLDLRTTGSTIIVAPSKHKSGRLYAWGKINPAESGLENLAEWPSELIEYFRSISCLRTGKNGDRPRTPITVVPVNPGERHQALCRLVGKWINQGIDNETIFFTARGWYERLPDKSGFPEKELEEQLQDLISRYRVTNSKNKAAAEDGDQDKEKQADALVRIGKTAELFKAPEGSLWARFQTGGHFECWPICSKGTGFRQWLVRQFVQESGTAPSITAVHSAIEVLEAEARFGPESTTREVFTRVAGQDGAIYLDLADEQWQAVKVTAEGWSIVRTPPVCFRRTRGMLPLPKPVRGEDLQLLDRIVNLGNEENRKLVMSWLVYCLNPFGPFPLLCFISEQGSGKSVTANMLRMTVDPSQAPTRALPKSIEDLAVAAQHSWVLSFDNLSYIPDSLSDALCRMATGGGFATRALYTNDDEMVFYAKRPAILNGISDFAGRPDLLERALIVHLPTIPKGERRTEDAVFADFERVRPALLGAVLDAAAIALKNKPCVTLSECPRMADFAEWTAAAASALGGDPGEMVGLLLEKQDERLLAELDAPLPQAVFAVLDERAGKFEGYQADLLVKLNEAAADIAGEETTRKKTWPQNSKSLGNALARLAPVMRLAGVNFTAIKRTKKGCRVLLERVCTAEPMGDDAGPKVAIGDGTGEEHRHHLTPQKDLENGKRASKGDGSDGIPQSFSAAHQKKGEGGAQREGDGVPPSPSSLPSPFPTQLNLLEGDL